MTIHTLNQYPTLSPFAQEGQELKIGHLRISELVHQFGTPLYVYDGAIIESAYQQLQAVFPSFDVFYSMKANASLGLSALLRHMGAGAEVASGGELQLALASGFDPNNIMYAGPAKTDDELAMAANVGIASINVESLDELARLAQLAAQSHSVINICLRINTKEAKIDADTVMIGGPSRFGIDEEVVFDAWDTLSQSLPKNICVKGIHVYTGSQILQADTIVRNLERTLSVAKVLSDKGLDMSTIVFGVGLGVPYKRSQDHVNLQELKQRIDNVLQVSGNGSLENTRLIVESGRFLVGESGVFLTKVIDVKKSRGKLFVSTDGGLNHFARPSLMGYNHPTFVVNKLGLEETETIDIGGPLCTPEDVLASDVRVPAIAQGDILGLFYAGGYGYSFSMLDFLGHPKPAEVLVYQNEVHVIRERGSFEDLRYKQSIPAPFV
ncbi:MAG: diaminopimelate decarboxylase [Chloroflexota bacterium]